MNRRHFLSLASVVCIATGAFVQGCGGGSGGGGLSRRTAPSVGGVSGRLGQRADGSLTLVYGALPGGVTPVSGATVRATGATPVTTAADGAFHVDGVPFGTPSLQVDVSGKPSLVVPLTVLPDAIVTVGAPPQSRDQALAAAKAALAGRIDVARARIFVPQQPLPVGAVLATALGLESVAPLNRREIARPEWLVYVDPTPGVRFAHTVHWALVDAQTGAATVLTDLFWPTVNGYSFYSDADAADLAQSGRARVAVAPAGAPPLAASPSGRSLPNHCATRAKDPPKTYALVVQGDPRSDFEADFVRFPQQAFGNDVFPPAAVIDRQDISNITYAQPRLTEFPDIHAADGFDEIAAVSHALSANLTGWFQSRLNLLFEKAKATDTVVVYFTTHGLRGWHSDTFYFAFKVKSIVWDLRTGADGEKFYQGSSDSLTVPVRLDHLDFSGCKACRIVIVLDTCYATYAIPLIAPRLQALTGKEVAVVFGSQQFSFEFEAPTLHHGHAFPAGGILTTGLLEGLALPRNEETFYERFGQVFAQAESTVALYDLYPPPQHPQLWTRTLNPDEACGGGAQNVTIH